MIDRRWFNKGWPQGRPFFLLLIAACAGCSSTHERALIALQIAPPVASELVGCAPVELARTHRFTADAYISGLPELGQWRDGFDLADFDGDGRLDLVHGPARKGDGLPSIFLGDANGKFSRWTRTHFPKLPYDYGDIKAGDVNGDGVPDLALASHLNGFVTLIHEGGGHFAAWGEGLDLYSPTERVAAPIGVSSRSIRLHDWNGDGRLDLLAVNEGPARFAPNTSDTAAFALWINRGGYWDLIRTQRPWRGFGDDIALGDVDGDRRTDALLGSQVLGARQLMHLARDASFSVRSVESLPADALVPAVALLDDSGDRRAKVFAATLAPDAPGFCSALQRIDWRESEEHTQWLWREPGTNAIRVLRGADLDSDGHAELVAMRRSGSIVVFAGSGSGQYTRDLEVDAPANYRGCEVFDAQLRDLDADGLPELIASYAGDGGALNHQDCPGGGGFATWHLRVTGR